MSLDGVRRSQVDSPQGVRRVLAAAALASVALLVYASLVPLDYRPLSWDDTLRAWRQIPWLSLDVFRRADWVANALAVLPAGILAAAAVDWGRPSNRPLIVASPLITFGLVVVVIGIELVQVWFPPRTVSLNDIAAGFVGAALGPVLWVLARPSIERSVTEIGLLPSTRDRLAWLGVPWFVCLILFSVLPLDLILSQAEWQEKVAAGRVQWNPLRSESDWRSCIIGTLLAALVFVPIGFSSSMRRRTATSRWMLLLLPIVLQLIRLPFFSKSFSWWAIVGGWLGGWIGYFLAKRVDSVANIARRPAVWAAGWGVAVLFAMWFLLGRYARVLNDAVEIKARFASAWTWPLVKYYAKSEYGAYTNMLQKMAVFAAIGACAAGWSRTVTVRRLSLVVWSSLVFAAFLANGIELVQVWLPPLVPDMPDAIVYLAGYAAGFYAILFVWRPADGLRREPISTAPKPQFHSNTNVVNAVNDRWFCTLMFAAGVVLLVYGSLVPFRFHSLALAEAIDNFQSQFRLPSQVWGGTADWSLNLTLMIPIAFFAVGAIADGRDRWQAWLAVPIAVLACFVVSLGVEFAQLWSVGRVASLRDVAAQTLGACIGVAAWLVVGDQFSAWRRSLAERRESQQKLEWVLQAYLIGLTIYSVVPVDLMMSPGELAEKYRSGLIELVPFTYSHGGLLNSLYAALKDVLLFVPVGMCAASAWNPRGRRLRPVSQSLLFGLLYTTGLEVTQLLVVGRYSSSTDVILGFAGVAAGVSLMHFVRSESRTTSLATMSQTQIAMLWVWGALAYSAFLAVIFWAPFSLTDDVEVVKSRLFAFIAVPFARMHGGSDLVGIFAAMRKVLWFVPLGAMCGIALTKLPVHLHRALLYTTAAGAILTVALTIELGQVLMPDKIADSTDVVLYVVGGLVGLLTARTVLDRGRAARAGFDSAPRRQIASSPQRLRGLDGLRALACLAVFGVHFQQATRASGRWGIFDLEQTLENGNTGVALFFVLSGFLLALPLWTSAPSTRGPAMLHGYVGKRLVRILPAYYLCLTALVLIRGHWQSRGELQDTLLHYLCLQNYLPAAFYSISSQFWTVAVQMQFYLVFALIVWGLLRSRFSTDRSMVICFAVVGLGAYFTHLTVMSAASPEQLDYWGPVLPRSVLAHLPLFLIGVLTSYVFVNRRTMTPEASPRRRLTHDMVFTLSAIAVIVILTTPLDEWFQIPFGRYNLPYIPLLLAIMIFVTPDSGFAAKLLEFAPIRLLGVISYGFFIYHLAVMGLVSRVMGMAGGSPQSGAMMFAGASILLTTAVAGASFVLIERPLLVRMTGQRPMESATALRQAATELR